ncbi:hypothetical protein TIFTF001_010243 [Ficus carica]|uniref:Rho-GAP domain-containing protein n=1 Tax=Ficus carica TaxID=3494 RepID=A0AA88AIP1_FICCA|nr:hypothetical protein TIFTF001_010243 [Ficus carica]
MPSPILPQWHDKATGFFSSSGVKIKEAGQSAGTFVGEVAKDAKGNVTDVAERVGSLVKSRWAFLQQPSTKHGMQERLISAAATTGTLFRRGFTGTKEKVAKKTAQKSKTILTDIERWQKGVASTDVFGVPIEVTVQREQSMRPIPNMLVKSADYLVLSGDIYTSSFRSWFLGLSTPYLFKTEADKKVIQQLVSLFNQDSNASIPESANPVEVAALIKCYLASLPDPLTTFELYNEIKGARSSINAMRNILKRLPNVNYMTLEFVTALLLRVSQKALLNKMDTRSLAMEMAPVIMWQKGSEPDIYRQYWSQPRTGPSNNDFEPPPAYSAWDMLSEEEEGNDASSLIPLDDGVPVDFGAIECLTKFGQYDHLRCRVEGFYQRFVMDFSGQSHLARAKSTFETTSMHIIGDHGQNFEHFSSTDNRSPTPSSPRPSMATTRSLLSVQLFLITSLVFLVLGLDAVKSEEQYPLVVSTWPFVEAVRAAWRAVDNGFSAVDAVVEGCSACEELRCDGTVGPGGSPDENGETTIDALVMNGATMEVGAVAAMRYVKDGIRAARLVMEHTKHTLLVGERASDFAISMGLPGPTNLSSTESMEKWTKWKQNHCQPNFWKNVVPINSCGPYHGKEFLKLSDRTCSKDSLLGNVDSRSSHVGVNNHDTISMAVIDKRGHIAVGTSTNGATFKIPGRVGDGPIAGSSSYADDEVGACGATGDGDIMMRFLPCYQVVESMRLGMEPKLAVKDAISRIARKFPDFVGAVFAVNKNGVHAGACYGWKFQYSVRSPLMDDVEVVTVHPHSVL